MRTSDFVPLIFPSLPIARRRLLKLMDAGVVTGVVHALHEDTRWQLDRAGHVLLGNDPEKRKARSISRLIANPSHHHFTLTRLWACVAYACFSSPEVKLKRFRFEWELDGDEINTHRSYRPDAAFTIECEGLERGFFVEVDCGTENVKYFVEEKIPPFSAILATSGRIYGIAPSALLLVANTEARFQAIARGAANLALPIFGIVFTEKTTELSLERGWRRLSHILDPEAPACGIARGTI